MKVVHLINTLSAGGAELHLLTLCRQLRRRGVEVVVACLREHVKDSRSLRPDFENAGIRVVRMHADHRYDLRFVPAMAALTRRERPALLHTHLPRADLAGAFRRFFDSPLPWVCSVHDIHDRSWAGKWTLPFFNRIWRKADQVVAISHAVKEWLITKRRVPTEKIKVIHYGIEPSPFSRPRRDFKERWNLDGHAIVGSVGRLEERKGHDRLIRAMPATLETKRNARLLIAGHDPSDYGKNLQAMIDRLGLKRHVQIVGVQNDIPSFLNTLDVFAFASRSEGFGQVMIEAMAAAKPVVASRIAPLSEIVEDGETGLLVDPDDSKAFGDAIGWLLNHPCQARQMGQRGQERVYRYFSAERMTEETLSVYRAVLGT